MMKVLDIEALSPEWHERRRTSLTGTDVIALMLGRYFNKTPLSIWARITGKEQPDVLTGKHLDWGRRSESLNRDWLESEAKRVVLDGPGLVAHEDYPWFVGTPDGFLLREDRDDRGVWEAKAPTVWTPQDWSERVPDPPQIQTQAYMAITGCKWGTASAVLVEPGAACPDLYYGDLVYDPDFQDLMMETITRFWEMYVQRDIRPGAGADAVDGKLLGKLLKTDGVTAVELPGDVIDMTWQRDAITAEMKVLAARKTEIDNRVKQALVDRDAVAGEDHEGNRLWTWREKKGGPIKAGFRKASRPLLRTKYAPE